uniref:Uncharacterized protein n=1 Tax=Oryza glumipatula TaxID=40148 RepID=A0A0D9YTF8_9ORYZ
MPLDGDASIPIPMVFDGGAVGVRRGGTWWTGQHQRQQQLHVLPQSLHRRPTKYTHNSSFTISPARTTTVADKEEKRAVLLALVEGQEEAAVLWEVLAPPEPTHTGLTFINQREFSSDHHKEEAKRF